MHVSPGGIAFSSTLNFENCFPSGPYAKSRCNKKSHLCLNLQQISNIKHPHKYIVHQINFKLPVQYHPNKCYTLFIRVNNTTKSVISCWNRTCIFSSGVYNKCAKSHGWHEFIKFWHGPKKRHCLKLYPGWCGSIKFWLKLRSRHESKTIFFMSCSFFFLTILTFGSYQKSIVRTTENL